MSQDLKDRIETIEEAFEYMMAYAAQGKDQEDPSEGGGIRSWLSKAAAALEDLPQLAQDQAGAESSIEAEEWAEFLEIVKADSVRARTLINFALAQPNLSSELVDNLNATNHIRTLLTDIFLLDSGFEAHEQA
tara:strand:+ start:2090 stop:2488 length:399 start_codon:yes stop_codon:yes gene_type:complete